MIWLVLYLDVVMTAILIIKVIQLIDLLDRK